MGTREILINIEEAIIAHERCTVEQAHQFLENLSEIWNNMTEPMRNDILANERFRRTAMRVCNLSGYDSNLDRALVDYLRII